MSRQCAEPVNKLVRAGKTDDACSIVASALRLRPGDDSLMHCPGVIEWRAGDHDLAREWLEKAVEAKESNAVHHLALGNKLAQDVSQVSRIRLPFVARRMKSEFERAVALDPTLIGTREGLVGWYLNAPGFFGGSDDQARAQAAEILRLNPMRGHLALTIIFGKRGALADAERELIESTRVAIALAPPSHWANSMFPRSDGPPLSTPSATECPLTRVFCGYTVTLAALLPSPDKTSKEGRAS